MTNLNKSLLALCMALGMAGSAAAQTCAAPGSFDFTNPQNPTITGDTCTGTSFFGDICDDNFVSPSNDAIYAFNVNSAGPAGFTATMLTLTVPGGSSFNPIIAILGPGVPCASSTPCPRSGSANGVGAGEQVSTAGLANGAYFLLVSGDPGSTTCGAFTVSANGSLPVQLKNFAID